MLFSYSVGEVRTVNNLNLWLNLKANFSTELLESRRAFARYINHDKGYCICYLMFQFI